MRKRHCKRFTKRLEVTFTSNRSTFRGISSDLSAGGIFIRTQNGLTPGTTVDIEVYLPDGKVGHLQGIVRRTVKTALSVVKNGMGVELVQRDQNYLEFLRKFDMLECPSPEEEDSSGTAADDRPSQKAEAQEESVIVVCPGCNVRNRVPTHRLSLGAKCGKCGAELQMKHTA